MALTNFGCADAATTAVLYYKHSYSTITKGSDSPQATASASSTPKPTALSHSTSSLKPHSVTASSVQKTTTGDATPTPIISNALGRSGSLGTGTIIRIVFGIFSAIGAGAGLWQLCIMIQKGRKSRQRGDTNMRDVRGFQNVPRDQQEMYMYEHPQANIVCDWLGAIRHPQQWSENRTVSSDPGGDTTTRAPAPPYVLFDIGARSNRPGDY